MPPTDIIPFTPDDNSAPPFSAQITTSEGALSLSTWWNMAGQRWYIKVEDTNGQTLLYRPLIGSTMTRDINLIRAISASSLVYREDNQAFEVGA